MQKTKKDIIKSASDWLSQPIQSDVEQALNASSGLVNQIKEMMQQDPGTRKELGALIGRIKGMQKAIENMELMDWVMVTKGHLAIGHRPGAKLGTDLKLQNTTHILTLLSEGEEAKSIEALAKQSGINWLWFPMKSAEPPSTERYKELTELFVRMKEILKDAGKIYVHCSAGIHRTGMISFALLRFLGMDSEEAKTTLKALRSKTSEQVGEERVGWANEVIQHLVD